MDETEIQKKQILVGINHLTQVGGSELYTYDLISELSKHEDIDVEFFAHHLGKFSNKLEKDLEVSFMSQNKYDLILAAHNTTVKSLYHKGPIIQICHGTTPELEQPSRYADFHVGITEEVCESLSNQGYENKLVLNGIDTNQKVPDRPINDKLQVILSLCQSEEANKLLARVCAAQNIEFICFDKLKNPTYNIEEEINKADMVIGIGRSIYDAMACGRPCVIFDDRYYNHNKADGYLYPHLFNEYIKNNCSGRYNNYKFNEEDILREIKKYNPKDGSKLRKIALERLNVEHTALELLDIDPAIGFSSNVRKKAKTFRKKIIKSFRIR